MKIVWFAFFDKQKYKNEVKFFKLLFGCKLAFVLKYEIYEKKFVSKIWLFVLIK